MASLFCFVVPRGIEPLSKVWENSILSVELQDQKHLRLQR